MKFLELDTPALLIDRERLMKNLADMQRYAEENGVKLRPHTKTHKTPRSPRCSSGRAPAALRWQRPARPR